MTPSAVLRRSSAAKAAVRSAARVLRAFVHDVAWILGFFFALWVLGALAGIVAVGYQMVCGC